MLVRITSKILAICAVVTLCSSTGAFAESVEQTSCRPSCDERPVCKPECKPERVCKPKPKCAPKPVCKSKCKPVCPPKPCCEPVKCPPIPEDCCERNVCTPTEVITPRVDLITGQGMDWFVTGDYIYWTARERGLEYAVAHAVQGPDAKQGATGGKEYHIGNKWSSGFKVGLGTDFCHDGWDLYAEYTWFKSNNKAHTPSNFPTTGPIPLGTLFLTDGCWNVNLLGTAQNILYSGASAEWRFNMNVVDLELGRNFYVSPRLMLRPFCGLKGAWNKQHMNLSFTGVDSKAELSVVNTMHNKIKNWGIGPRVGMDASWHFIRSLSIIGDLALTGLWEHFKMTRFDFEESSGVVLNSNVDFQGSEYSLEPVIEWMLGLKWETGISCDAYHLAITAAWEEQMWFEQNDFLRVPLTSSANGDNLSVQGLTVDVRFDF